MIFTGAGDNKILGMNDIIDLINHRCIICSKNLKKAPYKRYCSYNSANHLFHIEDNSSYNLLYRHYFYVMFKDVYGKFYVNANKDNAYVNYVGGFKDNFTFTVDPLKFLNSGKLIENKIKTLLNFS